MPDFWRPGRSKWFAVRVRSNFERTVGNVLRSKGLEEFVPTYRSQRRWSDRVKEETHALFPGYLFCRLEPTNRLPILSTSGVVSIVGIGHCPLPVDPGELEAIWRVTNSSLLSSPWTRFREGEPVIVEHGPLAGVQGRLVKIKNQHRLVVSITLLQRAVSVEVDVTQVNPVGGTQTLLARSLSAATTESTEHRVGPRRAAVDSPHCDDCRT